MNNNRIFTIEDNKEIETSSIQGLSVEWLGSNGILKVHKSVSFNSSKIQIGTNCSVEIGDNSKINNLFIRCASIASVVKIGKNFSIESGQLILAKGQRNQSIYIGDNCLFSSGIFIQTSDGHTILDLDGNVLNNSGGHVLIGNHVWLGHGVSVLKKARIADDTIVAESAVVSKSFYRTNCILGGTC